MADEQAQAPPLDTATAAAAAAATTARKAELQRRGTWQGSLVTEAHIQWDPDTIQPSPLLQQMINFSTVLAYMCML